MIVPWPFLIQLWRYVILQYRYPGYFFNPFCPSMKHCCQCILTLRFSLVPETDGKLLPSNAKRPCFAIGVSLFVATLLI